MQKLLAFFLIGCFSILPLCYGDSKASNSLQEMETEKFLRVIRTPLQQEGWGEFSGKCVYRTQDITRKGRIHVRILFSPSQFLAQITQDERNLYLLEQKMIPGKMPEVKFTKPEKESSPTLSDYGIHPDELTFSFLYWNFLEELTNNESRKRNCRRIRLQSPDLKEIAEVWFDTTYGLPMEVYWYRSHEKEAYRKLLLKGIQRYGENLWFIKEMRLENRDGKCRLILDQVKWEEKNRNQTKG